MGYAQANSRRAGESPWRHGPDYGLLVAVLVLMGLGLVMVASASLHLGDRLYDNPYHFLARQTLFCGVGLGVMYAVTRIPLSFWEKQGPLMFLLACIALMLVLVPGVGKSVNGSLRWLPIGPFNLQPSEGTKLVAVIYLAGYLVRHIEALRAGWKGFIRPFILLLIAAMLLLAEPDFGATAVMLATALVMMFLAGARLGPFLLLALVAVAGAVALVAFAEYRLERVLSFMDPWAHQQDSGYQLTQAFIAFGRGDWFGVGLGASVQKLFYLPEAHTDFLFAVLAEELGVIGAWVVVGLFAFIIWRAMSLGRLALQLQRPFAGHLATGLGILLALQAFINIGVNMGLLPTKGLTLPLMSYGGSSMLVACFAIGLLLRVDRELQMPQSLPAEDDVREEEAWAHA